ncbi:MAG TPA: hypothetical protein VLA62_08975, partial [Solirubrobacterales bacterium]|nr:hypothetical protein [Solirubrobacterales bacterium]
SCFSRLGVAGGQDFDGVEDFDLHGGLLEGESDRTGKIAHRWDGSAGATDSPGGLIGRADWSKIALAGFTM